MSAPPPRLSANVTTPDELAILEAGALSPWIQDVAAASPDIAGHVIAPSRILDIVDDLQAATHPEHLADQELRDATILATSRWTAVRCGQGERATSLLTQLHDAELSGRAHNDLFELTQATLEFHELEKQFADAQAPLERRVWAAIEAGILAEETGRGLELALAWYQKALRLHGNEVLALELAWRAALAIGELDLSRELLHRQLVVVERDEDPRSIDLLQELASLQSDPAAAERLLLKAHQLRPEDPRSTLRRLAWASASQRFEDLSHLYRLYAAQVRHDHDARISALHLALITSDPGGFRDDGLVEELLGLIAEHDILSRSDPSRVVALLRDFADRVASRQIPIQPDQEDRFCNVLSYLSGRLDDPREQALVHEHFARRRLKRLRHQLRETHGQSIPSDPEETAEILRSLRVCSVFLPELRWTQEATAEVLGLLQDHVALARHLEQWARNAAIATERASLLLRAGQVYEDELREIGRALEFYRQAYAEAPKDPDCLRALGRCYERSGQWADAVRVLQRQADRSDDPAEAMTCLRRVVRLALHQLQDTDLALASLRRLTEEAPDDLGALFLSAAIARREDRMGVLVESLERLFTQTEDSAARSAIAYELAQVLDQRLARHDDAARHYEMALQSTPGYAPSQRELARAFQARGESNKALALYLDQDLGEQPVSVLLDALTYLQNADVDDARRIRILARAATQLENTVSLQHEAVQALAYGGQAHRAYELLSRIPESRSTGIAGEQAYFRGKIANYIGQRTAEGADEWFERAIRHWRRAIELEPEHWAAFEGLYRILSSQGDIEGMDQLLARVEEHADPTTRVQLLTQRARLAAQQPEHVARARSLYEQALLIRPDDPVLRFELEFVLRRMDPPRALFNNLVRQAADATDARLKATLAVEAAETLLEATAGEELGTVGRLVLGALKSDPGNPHAVSLLEQILNLDPSVVPIRAAVSARAARAQTNEERSIFFAESAELLERAGLYKDALGAYRAAADVVPGTGLLEVAVQRMQSALNRAAESPTPAADAPSQASADGQQDLRRYEELVQRATDTNDDRSAALAVEQLSALLASDPTLIGAIHLLVRLARENLQRPAILRIFAHSLNRISDRHSRYTVGVLLGEYSDNAKQATAYLRAALEAQPDGLEAREALLGRYRELEDRERQAECIRQLLLHPQFAEPRKPALRRELLRLLAADPNRNEEALEQCEKLLRDNTRDVGLVELYSRLLEARGRFTDAAHALDTLLNDTSGRAQLHRVYLRQATLYSKQRDTLDAAVASIQQAIMARPDDPESVNLLIDLFDQAGRSHELDAYVPQLKTAMIERLSHGHGHPKDLINLERLLDAASHPMAPGVHSLHNALQAERPKHLGTAGKVSHRSYSVVHDERERQCARSPEEFLYTQELLGIVENYMDDLVDMFPVFSSSSVLPLPASAPVDRLEAALVTLAQQLNIERPVLLASADDTACTLLLGATPELRIGRKLWATGDAELLFGLLYVASARHLWRGARTRALGAAEIDTFIAATFEICGVFNPIAAEPDADRLSAVSRVLERNLSRKDRAALAENCEVLADADLVPGTTARACLASDLRLAALMSQDPRSVLLAASALDGVVEGSPLDRIAQSPAASALLGYLVGDGYNAVLARAQST